MARTGGSIKATDIPTAYTGFQIIPAQKTIKSQFLTPKVTK